MSAHDHSEVYKTLLANLHPALERWYSGDTTGYSDLFADEFTFFDNLAPGRAHNLEQLRARYSPLDGNINLPRYELVEPVLQLFGDTAVLTYNLRQFDHDGPVGPTFSATEVYRPIEDAWRVVSGHWSVMPTAD